MIRYLNKVEALLAIPHMAEDEVFFPTDYAPFHAGCAQEHVGAYIAVRLNTPSANPVIMHLDDLNEGQGSMGCVGCGKRIKPF